MDIRKNNLIFICLFLFFLLSKIKGNNSNNEHTLAEDITENCYITQNSDKTYSIVIDDNQNIQKILIDIMIFSGDIVAQIEKESEYIHKYETANKIFYSINSTYLPANNNEIHINIKAEKSSYFTIRYTTLNKGIKESELINTIPINNNFLITLYPYDSKGGLVNRKLLEFKIDDKDFSVNGPLLINFNSLNCAYKIYKVGPNQEETALNSKNNYYYQDFIATNDERYNSKDYKYIMNIVNVEQGTYTKKMCIIYASGTEINKKNDDLNNYILVGENVPQKIKFNNNEVTNIKYSYEIPNINNDIAIKFLLEERTKYKVNFYVGKRMIKQTVITSNQQEMIESSLYNADCEKDSECRLIVEIELSDENLPNKDYELEIAIKSVSSSNRYPSYIIKNKINSEYLNCRSPNYYYTDLGQKTSGEVIINFYRGNGKLFGKIVPKNQKPDKLPEWKGIYEFPSSNEGTLKYVSYLKKITFTEEDTKNCADECYLLLTITPYGDFDKYENVRTYGFDILINTYSYSIIQIEYPLITLPLDKYVIGSVSHKESSPDYRRYYIINIPYDAEKIIFDLQSENAAVYINLYLKERKDADEYKYPSRHHSHFQFYSTGKPQLFEITKDSLQNEVESFEGISFTICIETKINENEVSTIYAFKYHLEIEQKLNIYEVYSDQQTICNTTKIDESNKYKCLYLLKYNKNDVKYPLLLYPLLEDQSYDYQIYAKFIPREYYDLYKKNELQKLIPKNNEPISTETTKEKFLYINLTNQIDNYLFITIETDINNSPLRLLSTLSTFDYSSFPNPSTSQLFIIRNDDIKFSFIYSESIIINIISILGGGNIFWKKDEYTENIHKIKGRDDRLYLTSPELKTEEGSDYNTLVIRNSKTSSYEGSQVPDGFLFYLTFGQRSKKNNFDEMEYGKSSNLNYRITVFPLTVYFKLENINRDTNAFISIYYLDGVGKSSLMEKEFSVYAKILSDSSVFKIKNNPDIDISPDSSFSGIYDPSKRVCLISLNSTDFEKIKVVENENLNLVFRISKNFNQGLMDIYNHISIEGTLIQDNSLVPITEKIYQYGKLKKGSEKIVYKLSTNELKNIMYIIFSSNSDLLDYKISMDNEDQDILNEFQKNKFDSNGRKITYIHSKPEKNNYIYLTIFRKDKDSEDENLSNYVFKYINMDDISKIKLYNISDSNIIHTKKDNSTHLIAVEYIGCVDCLVTYYVNFILRSSLIKGENFNNIAVIQSNGITQEFEKTNVKVVDNKVNLNVQGIDKDKDIAYIQVIAHVNDGPINEYIAFKSLFNEKENEIKSDDDKGNKTFIIVVSVVSSLFVGVVIVLIIVIVRFNIKNKDLLNKVNTTSFVESKADPINEDENHSNVLLD